MKFHNRRDRGTWIALYVVFVFMSAAYAQEQKYSYKQTKRDPFVPLISAAGYLINLEPEDNSTLTLEGIMYDPKGDSVAIINGDLVRVGDTVGDAVLVSVEPTKVTVIKDNQKVELSLRREE